ncbi:hypothetical protein EIN_082280 [Entamoeba invadens IP1]|uniref:hypothetical protein n=1 Tax=Entamoeba invadens IP1 TaxID=370355 RepID=UPI0002C3E5F6|nr:hypothetical protein EIN_082280 [Entamoeba invadens IP1]ELP85166.1 hypothetical protein EIN_082280 [Entamoeba invadens IP1]|eukprot:XP_004184512.1 hypothetical protein EIN_082280 [Entamoeba invadens IP1]
MSNPLFFKNTSEELKYYKEKYKALSDENENLKVILQQLLQKTEEANNQDNTDLKTQNEKLKKELETSKQSWMNDVNQRVEEKQKLEVQNKELQKSINTITEKMLEEKTLLEAISKIEGLYKNFVDITYALRVTEKTLNQSELSLSEIKRKEEVTAGDEPFVNDISCQTSVHQEQRVPYFTQQTKLEIAEKTEKTSVEKMEMCDDEQHSSGKINSQKVEKSEHHEMNGESIIVEEDNNEEMVKPPKLPKSLREDYSPIKHENEVCDVEEQIVEEIPSQVVPHPHDTTRVVAVSGIAESIKAKLKIAIINKGWEYSDTFDEKVTHVVVHKKITKTLIIALLRGICILPVAAVIGSESLCEERIIPQLKGKKFFFSRIFQLKPLNREVKMILISEGGVVETEDITKCEIALIDEKEMKSEQFKQKTFTFHQFLRKLPFPKFVSTYA